MKRTRSDGLGLAMWIRAAAMPTLSAIRIHPQRTRRSGFQYQFTPKHHGGDVAAAQWLPALTMEQEFTIFDSADEHDLSDTDGRLYGVLRKADGELADLGTCEQQIAEFPRADAGAAWHGYPLWAVNDQAPTNRASKKAGLPKKSFRRWKQQASSPRASADAFTRGITHDFVPSCSEGIR